MLPIKSDLAYAIIFKPKSLIKTLQTKDSKTVGIFHNILRHKFFGRCLLTPNKVESYLTGFYSHVYFSLNKIP